MAKIAWTRIMIREFEYLVPMTDDQRVVFNDMVKGESVVQTAMKYNMSTRKVDYIRKWLKQRYDEVKVYTPLLP